MLNTITLLSALFIGSFVANIAIRLPAGRSVISGCCTTYRFRPNIPRFMPLRLSVLLVAGCLFLSTITVAYAQLTDHAGGLFSTDTTSIEFSYVQYHFKIPRNYIAAMSHSSGGPQGDVTLQVMFPGAKPYSDETKNCFLHPWMYSPSQCVLIEFHLATYPIFVDDRTFFNSRRVFISQIPKHGPFGFDEYDIGPDSARISDYIKVTSKDTIVASCFVNNPTENRAGICESATRTKSGIILNISFDFKYLAYLEEIDIGLQQLFDSFSISRSGK